MSCVFYVFQDVMLSATSTQSPLATVSSVFTMPTVSSVSVANNTGISGLHDQLFTSVPSVGETNSTHTVTDIKPEINGSYFFPSLFVSFFLAFMTFLKNS